MLFELKFSNLVLAIKQNKTRRTSVGGSKAVPLKETEKCIKHTAIFFSQFFVLQFFLFLSLHPLFCSYHREKRVICSEFEYIPNICFMFFEQRIKNVSTHFLQCTLNVSKRLICLISILAVFQPVSSTADVFCAKQSLCVCVDGR